MGFYVAYVFIVLLLFANSSFVPTRTFAPKNINLRIQNGIDSPIGEYPYIVRMEVTYILTVRATLHSKVSRISRSYSVCTAAQIAPAWSLTAAHCVRAMIDKQTSIERMPIPEGVDRSVRSVIRYWELGDLTLNKTSAILKMFKHPNYDEQKRSNDIGLVKTNDTQMKSYGKISAVDHNTLIGLKATIVGFGKMNETIKGKNVFEDTLILQQPLQVAEVMIKKCELKLIPITERLKTAFCLASPCGSLASICEGDSGGPLIQGGQIVGVNSANIFANCQRRNPKVPPYIYHLTAGYINPVSPYIDWIHVIVQELGR